MKQRADLPDRSPQKVWATNAVVLAAVLFNALLALINANFVQLNSIEVIGFEGIIDAAAIALSIRIADPLRNRWLGLMGFLFVLNLANAIGSGFFDPKFLRDVLIIPIFALLGLTSDRDNAIRMIVRLQWIVLVVMLFEAISPDQYGRFFNVMSYYINTRGFEQQNFWAQDSSNLFISATRPDERYLMAFLNIHRLSSVFLEPVSLGNYCVIVTMALVALWDRISQRDRLFLVASTVVILVGSDGRFASTTMLIMIVLRFVAPSLPRYCNVGYLPGILLVSAIVVSWAHLSSDGDDFPTRTAGSIGVLSWMDFEAIAGGATQHAYAVMDSGIGYLLYSQSLIGASAVWIAIALGLPQHDRPSIVYAHAASVYVALNLLISYSMFSIKTAALLWFVFGVLSRRTSEQPAPAARRLLRSPSRPPWWGTAGEGSRTGLSG